jgi:SAM-dependent methyltransferase
MNHSHYVIQGGIKGRERLRILSRVMQPATLSLFERVGLKPGASCLDVGCGGGDVTCDLARLVGPTGQVLGIDIDDTKLTIARSEAELHQLNNVMFELSDIAGWDREEKFDVVYSRFLLTHLKDPAGVVVKLFQVLKPGGVLLVEDINFAGILYYPDSPAFHRYMDLYTQVVQRRGGDPNIGLRLPILLLDAGFEQVQMNVVQPAGIEGEVKLINPITMDLIREAVLAEGLASEREIEQVIAELYEFAYNPRTVASIARVVQTWGYRPGL